jgi:hypothetical protein
MTTIVLTFGLFAAAMSAMAVGVMVSGRQLKGSCGGPGSADCLCEIEQRRACPPEQQAL